MPLLEGLLNQISDSNHRNVLSWFNSNIGGIFHHSEIQGMSNEFGFSSVIPHHGPICHPARPDNFLYALSVRQSREDLEEYNRTQPSLEIDGSWITGIRESNNPNTQRSLNEAIRNCSFDNIPIAVIRQEENSNSYRILGLALVQSEINGYFLLQGITPFPGQNRIPTQRTRITRDILNRRGQPRFRNALLLAYDGKCAITQCNAVDALEAAHIRPVSEDGDDSINNGFLLRADIHTLFDLDHIGIDEDFKIVLSPVLQNSLYAQELKNVKLHLPNNPNNYPDEDFLKQRFQLFSTKWTIS